ncbi:hypothetical protein COL5a_002880 [Colletotrichum fioriniae]|uniref:uncharacterized protein n=1 Tax=Colletotrichum fioriniae TaxID=710243 RepID=UPI0023012777|nr:uncharacterized protein COL516b_009988 [Colletotrichum fioriniae]KAJ0298335.1 hypothetical protein COL516b_009988 [Colletotrichum fioriniae]KAJ0331339.1 hypothetical protein COL5a_002880 [Colletotrichum fioriniae]KAJ3950067.1 hypothetical protein N0V96_001203 [Colletotrichum fioriniae]
MEQIFGAEKLERWLQEIRGQSSNRPYRVVQESLAWDLITALYHDNFAMVKERCAPDVMLLVDIQLSGQIFHGLEEIKQYFQENPGWVDEKMTIVDRLRITYPVEFFSTRDSCGRAFKQRRLIILDMNNNQKFVRIEMRPVGRKESVDPDAPIPQDGLGFGVDNSL